MRLDALEVCVESISGVKAAIDGGAHRVELCADLAADGLTPAFEAMVEARRLADTSGLKVHVIIRPRPGNFVYNEAEVCLMEHQIALAREAAADGVVIGALTLEGDVDMPSCRRLMAAAQGMSVTFHRAFDVCRDPVQALEQIVSLGCSRILSSGQAPSAAQGVDLLRDMVRQAAGRIIIMPGAGVNPDNAAGILRRSGAVEIHGSFRSMDETSSLHTDKALIQSAIQNILNF